MYVKCMANTWKIEIPVRPKAVQSVRFGRTCFYQDPKIRKWKLTILPYIQRACTDRLPSDKPIVITSLRYSFKLPQLAPKALRTFVEQGGTLPYIGKADITDNLAKGLIDTCKGLVFVDDRQIWRMCNVEKVYGQFDGISVTFEETTDTLLVGGKKSSASSKSLTETASLQAVPPSAD